MLDSIVKMRAGKIAEMEAAAAGAIIKSRIPDPVLKGQQRVF